MLISFNFLCLLAASAAPVTDGKSYEQSDYYAFNEYSYYDIDNDMSQDRIPQPTNKAPSK